jgi:tetratricopeptide (TPR) repeat protein
MHRDGRGLELSGADGPLAASIGRFQEDFQGFRSAAAGIFDLADEHPACIAAQLWAASLAVYSQVTTDIEAQAGPRLARAGALLDGATERERILHRAVSAWAGKRYGEAADAFEALLARWPEDVNAVKLAEFVFFEAPDYPRHLRLMDSVAAANADLPAFGAMHAFANELNRRYDDAESIGRDALERDPDTPWAQHALAHLYLNTVRLAEGTRLLTEASPSWDGHTPGIRSHNAWHLALLHLADLDVEAVWTTHRRWCDQKEPSSAFEHTDAISLLWRLELSDLEVPDSAWSAFLPWAAERADDDVTPFLGAHYLYALTRAGERAAARESLARLEARSVPGTPAWRSGLPLLRGVVDLAAGDVRGCVASVGPVLGSLACIGGSDAQNDLFAQSYLVALARSGRVDEATRMLRGRAGDRPFTAQEESWLRTS